MQPSPPSPLSTNQVIGLWDLSRFLPPAPAACKKDIQAPPERWLCFVFIPRNKSPRPLPPDHSASMPSRFTTCQRANVPTCQRFNVPTNSDLFLRRRGKISNNSKLPWVFRFSPACPARRGQMCQSANVPTFERSDIRSAEILKKVTFIHLAPTDSHSGIFYTLLPPPPATARLGDYQTLPFDSQRLNV